MKGARKDANVVLSRVMVLLCAIWGFQQMAIKLAAADSAPLLRVALRPGILEPINALAEAAPGASGVCRTRRRCHRAQALCL